MNGSVRPLEGASADLRPERVVDLVADWIEARNPGAVIRFGEGEGRLLVADPHDGTSMRVALRKIRRQTGMMLGDADVLEIKHRLMRAFDEADVVGIHGSKSFNEEHAEWVRRIEAVFADREAHGRKPAYVTHCLVSNALSEALPALLENCRTVSLVTCRDLAAGFESRFGLEDVAVYQVPSQYIMRNIDDEFEAKLHGVPIWPDFYRGLHERVEVREPGEVFLVGAGLFGKELCIRIRELGGIALDMGSVLDKMAGKITRGPKRPPPYTA